MDGSELTQHLLLALGVIVVVDVVLHRIGPRVRSTALEVVQRFPSRHHAAELDGVGLLLGESRVGVRIGVVLAHEPAIGGPAGLGAGSGTQAEHLLRLHEPSVGRTTARHSR